MFYFRLLLLLLFYNKQQQTSSALKIKIINLFGAPQPQFEFSVIFFQWKPRKFKQKNATAKKRKKNTPPSFIGLDIYNNNNNKKNI